MITSNPTVQLPFNDGGFNKRLLLQACFDKMPDRFKGRKFAALCRKNGLPQSYISNGACSRFLRKNCIQTSRSIWTKKELNNKEEKGLIKTYSVKFPTTCITADNIDSFFIENSNSALNENNAIEYLKQLGYRIQKIETNYIDV